MIIMNTINGIGDKLINIIGGCVYGHYKKIDIKFLLNENILYYKFGSNNCYDLSLFSFDNIQIYNNRNEINMNNEEIFYLNNPDTIVSITPYSIYKKLINEGIETTLEEVSNTFIEYAQKIKPSRVIEEYLPNEIEKSYGIHLRRSDKIKPNPDVRHEMTQNENDLLIEELKNEIKRIIERDDDGDLIFYISSEDKSYAEYFENEIKKYGNEKGKNVRILKTREDECKNISNFNSILDLFSLSKCKYILQGNKYSAFSVIASLIGNRKLINFSHYLNNHNICIIQLWNSVLFINDSKNFNNETYDFIINKYKEYRVFYGEIYISSNLLYL